ncbi:hypothetical protein [Niabella aurantiaca]|uniref:hypothetical protein n=1 Tax=Niabella aurantiaca TaxID=379900 RepID=UPI00038106BA|nr:hypothetical protein [Niabella aurantiaca]
MICVKEYFSKTDFHKFVKNQFVNFPKFYNSIFHKSGKWHCRQPVRLYSKNPPVRYGNIPVVQLVEISTVAVTIRRLVAEMVSYMCCVSILSAGIAVVPAGAMPRAGHGLLEPHSEVSIKGCCLRHLFPDKFYDTTPT